MTADPSRDWDESYADATPPPWDIGRPQPQFEAVARAGGFAGRVLDCGCGTGENALLAASFGAEVHGFDLSTRAIAKAREKAAARNLSATFEVADALELSAPSQPYDVVIDSGVFHSFDDEQRPRYVAALARVLRPGGTCYLMCFSELEPGNWGPRRVREDELRAAFAHGWSVELTRSTFDINEFQGSTEVQAWFATLTRTS